MRDMDVRLAVRSRLKREHEHDADTRIVEEMGVWHGSVRIDLAVINGELAGYELKSARDTLDRLPAQASLYNQVFDRVVLVVADNHLHQAVSMLPDWWGVFVAYQAAEAVNLEVFRAGAANLHVCPMQLARLLWKSEALAVLDQFELSSGLRSASREKIAQRLATSFDLPVLAREVRRVLKDRSRWLGQPISH